MAGPFFVGLAWGATDDNVCNWTWLPLNYRILVAAAKSILLLLPRRWGFTVPLSVLLSSSVASPSMYDEYELLVMALGERHPRLTSSASTS